jgi:hypothetical protein
MRLAPTSCSKVPARSVAGRAAATALPAAAALLLARPAAASPPPPAEAVRPEIVVRAPWGAGVGELGRRGGDESNPEGPMSFAVSPSRDIWVLDQVNARLVRFGADGRAAATVPLDRDTYQDVALAPWGGLVLLDRLVARTVLVLDVGGAYQTEVGLVGEGIAEGGGTTALFAGEDGVWVEYGHRRSVQVLDGRIREPPARKILAGRPLGAGVAGHARLRGPSSVEVWTTDRASDALLARTVLDFDERAARIAALGADAQGNVTTAVHDRTEDPEADWAVVHSALVVVTLDPALVERRRFTTTPSVGAWEQFKEFEVSADGAVWQMAFVDEGVEVRRWLP